jgi:rubrerythrin
MTSNNSLTEESLVYRLQKRAEIRRQIPGRKSVQENKPDRIADLLEEAAKEILYLKKIATGPWRCNVCGNYVTNECAETE